MENAPTKTEKQKNTVVLSIRIPADLHKNIRDLASEEDRSVNWEISWLLSRAMDSLKAKNESQNKQAG